MSTLPRYVLAEFLKVFLVALLAATLLMLIVGVATQAVRQGLGLAQIAQLMPYILPDALRFATPGATLFAACSVFGRLASSNEIVAVKALGVSPMALLWPVFIAGALMSFVALWLNDVAVSWGRSGIRRVVIESVEEIAYAMLRTQRSYSTRRFSINVRSVEDRTLVRPTITFQASGSTPAVTITAEQGELRTDSTEDSLTVRLYNGRIDIGDEASMRFPGQWVERVIPLPDASNDTSGKIGPSQLSLRAIPDERVAQRQRIADTKQRLAAKAAYQMMTGQLVELTSPRWRQDYDTLQRQHYRHHRLKTEPHRRWANGFSCFCFILVGAPLAIRLRNADFLTSFFLCFLPILIVYYPLMALGVGQAKSGALPPQSVWLGNILLLVAGGWILRKVLRH